MKPRGQPDSERTEDIASKHESKASNASHDCGMIRFQHKF